MVLKRLFIPGPAGRLQALYEPRGKGRAAMVICHPHPQYGGTMRNKVVYTVARAFADSRCATLRFNFRGVERSEGAWDEGRGEVEDVRAALDWMALRCPKISLWMAGFSFGCYAGLKAARSDARIERMFAVAPAVNHWDFSFMQGEMRPVTVIHGDEDAIVPLSRVRPWVKTLPRVRFHVVEGADHFFSGHLQDLRRLLAAEAAQ